MQKRGQSILGAKHTWDSNPVPPDGKNRPKLGRENRRKLIKAYQSIL